MVCSIDANSSCPTPTFCPTPTPTPSDCPVPASADLREFWRLCLVPLMPSYTGACTLFLFSLDWTFAIFSFLFPTLSLFMFVWRIQRLFFFHFWVFISVTYFKTCTSQYLALGREIYFDGTAHVHRCLKVCIGFSVIKCIWWTFTLRFFRVR